MENEKATIILGVTGGIAVYKAADLCSKLSQKYNVLVAMTANARKLISDRIFMTLSGNPVLTDLFETASCRPAHVDWAQRAKLMIVAPCTANFAAKLTHGIADDALSTTALAFRKTILLATAMNTAMLESPAYQDNIRILKERGVRFLEPAEGHLACGTGKGRMREPAEIMEEVERLMAE